jgi:integrase
VRRVHKVDCDGGPESSVVAFAGEKRPVLSARKIADQLGHSKVSMTQDRYLGRRQTADVLERLLGPEAQ